MNAATKLPTDVGPLHFVGIGGIGMSGIAEVLLNLGYDVQGSDLKASRITERLEALGARVFVGQRAACVRGLRGIIVGMRLEPGVPAIRALHVAPALGNDVRRHLVLRPATRANQPHRLPSVSSARHGAFL